MESIKKYINPTLILKLILIVPLSILIGGAIYFFYLNQLSFGFGLLILPFVISVIIWIFFDPRNGIILLFICNYYALGITRYLPAPLGLSIDGLLVLTWLSVLFSQFNHKVYWSKGKSLFTFLAFIWYAYALFEFVNPQVISRQAWFYAMRGVSLYMLLTIPLVRIVFNKEKDLDSILNMWAVFTLTAVVKGVMQKVLGPDPWEHRWLMNGGGVTHLLPGGLRIFSFFTDAGNYGASMGFSGVVFGLLFLHTASKKRYFWMVVSLLAFFGMMISGTRGALAVPVAGMALYCVVSKNFKILFIGAVLMIGVYGFLKFSSVGNTVYEIRRIRTALDPDNPSLNVRLENQKKLKSYLSDKPFGGGIGSAGNWGMRFTPNTFLANTPTDSWYVQIWAEQGIIGLYLHLFILICVVGYSGYYIMFQCKTERYKVKATALLAGMFGIMAASYGNGVLGQMPNGIIIYMSMAFISLMKEWEEEIN